jgi:uncharacterized membrane protein YdbT with pleckstrin-like domain
MGYPRKLLADGESVDLELRNHWKALVRPVLVLLVVVFLAGFGAARVHGSHRGTIRIVIAVIAVLLLLWLTLLPLLRWWTTIYVLTDRRLILRQGIIARSGRDIPLIRVNDVSFSHTAFERLLGCGTLVVESAGERGQVTLKDIPHVEQVQRRLYELVEAESEADQQRRTGEGPGATARP